MKYTGLFALLVIFSSFCTLTFGIKIYSYKTIKLSEKILLQFPINFCVTEDEVFLVVDFKAGDVKVFNNEGTLEKVIGKKGFGPNEFTRPYFCYYTNRKFIITDSGQRKFFFYDRVETYKFERTSGIFSSTTGDDIHIKGNIMYLAGNKISKDGTYYSLFATNIDNSDRYIYLLPSYLKFGMNSNGEYKTELFKKPDLTTIGVKGKFDINGNFAYYIWEGDLKIFKINLKTKEISTFGKKMPHYVKPYTTPKLINAFFSRQGSYVGKERRKMSYVKQIYTTKKHVMVIYSVPGKNDNENGNVGMAQFYDMDGNFIEEIELPGKAPNTMWFDKKENFLYVLTLEMDSNLDESHYIQKYSINEN